MHRRQTELLVGAEVARLEARHVRLRRIDLAVDRLAAVRRQQRLAGRHDESGAHQAAARLVVAQVAHFLFGAAVHHRRVEVRRDLVDLLAVRHRAEQHRRGAAAAHGARARHANAAVAADARVARRHRDREARRLVVARLVAEAAVAELRRRHRLRHQRDVVVDELAPLHQHVGVALVGGDTPAGGELERDGARARQREPIQQLLPRPACNGRRRRGAEGSRLTQGAQGGRGTHAAINWGEDGRRKQAACENVARSDIVGVTAS